MKKKLLSLLLVIAIMMSSVSMGLSAFAAPAGKGVEAINAFELTANTVSGTSGTASVKIKSNNSSYKIKVNSITGYYKYMESGVDTSKTVSFSIGSDNVCGTSDVEFTASVSIDANLSALIRYECNYDLVDANGNTIVDSNGIELYKGMTGIGYGYISADGDEKGQMLGTSIGEPDGFDNYGFDGFDSANTLYVQVATSKLYANCETGANAHSTTKTTTVTGNKPSTLTINDFSWPYRDSCGDDNINEMVWFELTTPPSGYYNFNITFYDGDSYDVEMYYREDTHKNSADTTYNSYLDNGREKSYYDETSWDTYIKALDKVALVAIATPNDNYSFEVACETAADLSTVLTELENAENNLVQLDADYTAAYDAYWYFHGNTEYNASYTGVKNKTVAVTTYVAGSTSYGSNSDDFLYYDADSIQAVENYVAGVDLTLKKCDQNIVDGYEATIREMTANLSLADAVYTYLDVAINEYYATDSSIYTTSSWSSYTTAVNNAEGISRSLKTDSQQGINNALVAIFNAKKALVKLPADFTELNVQISRADEIWAEYNAGKMLTAVDGFGEIWGYFETYYGDATSDSMKDSKIDQQTAVNTAANNLKEAVNALAKFRLLDTTELENALALWPEYTRDKYDADSYDTWFALWNEGSLFSEKAALNYQGDDRKTYENYEEMVRLTDVIINAFNSLEKIKADFTALNEAVANIPSDEELALYEDTYVQAIKDIVATIDYGATFDEQAKVDEITENLNAALAELTSAHYKSADYTDVDKAIEEAEALDENVYTNFSIVEDAISAVDRTKKIVEQDEVDAMAAAIREAIDNLEYIPADYTDVDKAIEEANAVENKDWYANYDKVTEAINAVDRTKNHGQQDEVDAMAAAIREAIANLKLADADYSGIKDAIADYNAKAPLTDFYSDTVDAVDQAIANVEYGLKADEQDKVDVWEAEIREAIEAMKLLPADYSRLNVAKDYAESLNKAEYTNYNIVEEAIAAVDWDLNCRQNAEMNAQIDAINEAVANLKLLPADYTKVDEEIEAARYAYNNGDYPYTPESIQAVEDVISSINWDYDIKHQADVDAYILKIQIAVAQLKYVRADYDELDAVKAKYDALQRDLYASLSAVDAYVAKIDWDKTIDKQSEVDTYAAELDAMIEALEYAPADYTAVDNAITIYNAINKEYYEEFDIAVVDQIIAEVVRDLKKNEQARVDEMAQNINDAVAELRTKMKKADLTALTDAVEQANAKIDEMRVSGYDVDLDTYRPLNTLLTRASEYNEDTTIDNQEDIDSLTASIIEATANLEYVFTIILDDSGLVIEDGYIYGFEEGTTSDDARELIKFVGAAELKIIETKNGFGTGTMIQFVSTKDGSILGTYTVLVFGDANGDAVIDMFDVAYVVEIVNEASQPSDMLLRVLDVSMDGSLDVYDVSDMIGIANMDWTLSQDGSMTKY